MNKEEPVPFDQAVLEVHQTRGIEAVQQGFGPELISGYRNSFLMQLLRLPSFTSVIGWQIYQRNPVIYQRHPIENDGKPRFTGCRTEWQQEEDVKRFSSPVRSLEYLNRLAPTLKFQTVELDPVWIQEKLSEVYAVSVPPFVKSGSFGIDGERYEIYLDNFMTHTRLNWWCEGPDEWRPLTQIVFGMLEELEDTSAYDAAMASGDEVVPFDQAVAEIERGRE